MTGPRYTKQINALPSSVPFVGPDQSERERGAPFVARLGANENGFGPTDAARDAMQRALTDVWKYGDATSFDLRQALANDHSCTAANIVVGEGIDGLLGTLVRLLIGPGDVAVTTLGTYPTFNYHVAGVGGRLCSVPYADDQPNLETLFDTAADVDAKIVYLVNPDNPMGSWHTGEDIARAMHRLPAHTLLLLDEAYIDCAPVGTEVPLPFADPRLIRMRTFSKAYGLAGARIGYALGHPELIRSFDKIRNHFGVNLLAQAGALAAIGDQAGLQQRVQQIAAARAEISRIVQHQGLTPLRSATNFVTVDCGRDGAFAKAVLQALLARDIFVRMPFYAPQDRAIRISCAPFSELERFAHALPHALSEACQQPT